MKTLEFLRKISFREGFFALMMFVAVVLYVIRFVHTQTEKTLAGGIALATICLLTLCFLTDFPKFP